MLEIPFLDWLLNISNNAVMLGANFMVQSTIILIAGLCTAYVMNYRGAAVQSLIFRTFLMAVFLCPLLSIFIYSTGFSRLTLNVPLESVKYSETASSLSPIEQNDTVARYVPMPDKVNTRKVMVQKSNEKQLKDSKVSLFMNNIRRFFLSLYSGYTHTFPLSGWAVIYIIFTALWTSLSLFYLIRLSFSYLRILYIRFTAIHTDITIIENNEAIAHQLKVEPPLVLQSSLIRSPLLTGLFKPVVIMPVDITEVKDILVHELAHLVRRDCLWNLLSHIGIALLPFQPLMKVFSNRIEDMSDYVCDDYVLKYSGTSRSYARQLVSLAERFQPVYSEKVAGVGVISSKSGLLRRVKTRRNLNHLRYLNLI